MNRWTALLVVAACLRLGVACATAAGRDGWAPSDESRDPHAEAGSSGSDDAAGPDGASSSSDGMDSGSPGVDASMGPRIACGGTFCRSDQACVQGGCAFACSGTNVPGDYASLNAAVTALAAAGADATICLRGDTSLESVTISDPGEHNKTLRIVGASSSKLTLGATTIGAGFSEISLVGFGVNGGLTVRGASKVDLRALSLVANSASLRLIPIPSAAPMSVTVDACDITTKATNNHVHVAIENLYAAPLSVTVKNNYIHGPGYGVYVTSSATALTLVNNTIEGTNYGLDVAQSTTNAVVYSNNIFSNNSVAVRLEQLLSTTHSNNALFDNVNNYAGIAVDGPGYVKQDCMLDRTAPVPETKPGSPCRGAGDAAKAPPNDYWNAPRGAAADIGAVEGS